MHWLEEEEAVLCQALESATSWPQVASALPTRSAEGCRKRAARLGLRLGGVVVQPPRLTPDVEHLLDAPTLNPFEWLTVLEHIQSLADRADPRITSATIPIPTTLPIAVMFTSCWHLGGRSIHYPGFRNLFRRTLETPRIYWGVHGDLTEGFLPGFPNATPILDQLIHPKFQRGIVTALLADLARNQRLLYGCAGNHEDFLTRVIGEDLIAPEFQQRRIPYFIGKGVINLVVGEETYILAVAHEWPGNSQWNPTHAEGKALKFDIPQADFVVGGHKHVSACQEIHHHTLAHDAGLQPNHKAHLIKIGTAKSGPDPYAIKGWSRGQFEFPIFILYPDRHLIKRAYDWEDMEYFLQF